MMSLAKEDKAFLCTWFSSLLSHELTEEQLKQYQDGMFEPLFELLSEQGLSSQVQQIQSDITQINEMPYGQLELAADFTQLFLLDGQVSALPYASAYLEEEVLTTNLNYMDSLLEQFGLQFNQESKEPSDHIGVYLEVLGRLVTESDSEKQQDFVQNYLLTWLIPFNKQVQKVTTKTMFYQNIVAVLVAVLSQ
ncbi:molecular chaperone TorD [Pasteurella skyensis]|uniref:Molecular chaperone TorD n=1 Tax=Phocoenobacter skyensis TaxID=97481 RepID=A0AAJ6NB07_9PAST|nr:molecular chaperone TorD [Pasteurella skyensis]MDP8163311.1 molecular chaperone TorD [Pasteurella skyensis]MDP8173512.1 molecular chaperone TorD [Pasteurella skyensis]MDP8177259.1 molecular chaperone TorD [Pasteurella skyensis]MDP8179759.1 molecular chaperone TorD [Pasteurella skyensis]MDP8183873.1 molecular chaperone TorD [Pasteurella skyensis]